MKIERLLLGLFASFLMVGCSQNDDLPNGGEEQTQGKDSYIAVRIYSSNDLGSRANATADGDFADATGDEGNVTNAHFFFFNDNGEPVNVGDGKNYKEIAVTKENENANAHIESLVSAVLVLEKPENYPTRMVTVLNWDYSGASLNMNSLMTKTVTEAEALEGTKGFLMSNSVYYSEGIVNASIISGANFASTPDLAKDDKHAVDVYVERLAAKVTSILKTADNTYYNTSAGAYDTGVTYRTDEDNGPVKIYAKVLGWQVNTTNPTSYMVKQIESSWGTTAPFEYWNEADKRRSYWGKSVTTDKYNRQAFSWEDGIVLSSSTDAAGQVTYTYADWNGYDSQTTDAAYCLENTSPNVATKAVFKAQLGTYDETDGFKALTIWQWFSKYYLTLDAMMEDVVSNINARIADKNTGTAITLTANDIKLVYNTDSKKAYQILFEAESDVASTAVGETTVGAIVAETVHAKKWQDGATYYFTEINHLGYQDAVIRNHAYQLQVTQVVGLGTPGNKPKDEQPSPDPDPTPDPDPDPDPDPIIPEPVDPSDTETYIAAKINVLSWRLVNNNVVLGQ